VNQEPAPAPAIRSWRDIPQPVKPRAMSRGGRWRRAMRGVRIATLAALGVGLGWGTWLVTGALSKAPRHVPEVAKSVPLRRVE
jgi:hypothetical protein